VHLKHCSRHLGPARPCLSSDRERLLCGTQDWKRRESTRKTSAIESLSTYIYLFLGVLVATRPNSRCNKVSGKQCLAGRNECYWMEVLNSGRMTSILEKDVHNGSSASMT
jgi:hypothetical protein